MDLPKEILDFFSWSEISIQQDDLGNWFLILATTKEQSIFIYNIISLSPLKLEISIDPITKVYSFNLVFRYNEFKDIEYFYNTNLTSEGYPSLLKLNNGSVKFITTGVQNQKNANEYYYYKPLLPLDCVFHPN